MAAPEVGGLEAVQWAMRVSGAGERYAGSHKGQARRDRTDCRMDLFGQDDRRHQQDEPTEHPTQRDGVDERDEAAADQGTDDGGGGDESR